MVVEIRQAAVEVDGGRRPGPKRFAGQRVLLGRYEEIDVAVRTEARLGVEPGRGPALHEQRLHAGLAQERHHTRDLLLVDGTLEGVHSVGGMQRLGGAVRRRREPRPGLPQTPPPERSATGGEKQGHDGPELGGRGSPGRRRRAPRAGQRVGQPPAAVERGGTAGPRRPDHS